MSISELQLLIHSNPDYLQLHSWANPEKENSRAEKSNSSGRIDKRNAYFAFSQLAIRDNGKRLFCDDCFIYMESCHLGHGDIPQIIADATKCKVRAALGFSCGKPYFPSHSRSREKVGRKDPFKGYKNLEKGKKNGYKIFYPKKQ